MKNIRHALNSCASVIFIFMILALTTTGCCSDNGTNTETKAKYIFLMIGDGMGASNVAAAESYLSYKAGKLGGEQLTFTKFPVLGMATTYSANCNITCSSASGTAISCGVKTNNGYLGIDPEGNRLESFAYKLHKEGYNIGIMSTVPVNHATPAAFYGHNISRNAYYSISQEIPQSGFEFFAGEGFLDYYGQDGKQEPITDYLAENGTTVCFSAEEFETAKASAKQIVLCQPSTKEQDAEAYTVGDDDKEDFTLGEMLEKCLDYIGEDEPFFVMCEGGKIDWDAHDNQTMPMIAEIIDFNGAIDVAYEFYKAHPDETLIVVTADHETGGIALGGPGGTSKNGDNIYWDVFEKAGVTGADGKVDSEKKKELNREANIGWTTTGHAGSPVPVYAMGKGAEKFAGRMDNTDISKFIMNTK